MTKAAHRTPHPAEPAHRRTLWSAVAGLTCLALPTARAQTPGELAIPNYLGIPAQPPAARTPSEIYDPAEMVQLNSGVPYRAPRTMPRQRYNLRMGLVTANFFSSLNTTFTDNIFGAPSGAPRESDLSLSPMVGMSLTLPVSQRQALRVDLGVGYRYSINHPELNAVFFAPSSSIDYRLVVGDVLITFFDTVSSASSPPPQIAGGAGGSSIDFARIDNTLGVSASWMLDRYTSLSGSYRYQLGRGLNDQFSLLDLDAHSFSAAVFRQLHPYWTAGVATSYTLTTFPAGIQNGSTAWSVGPVLAFQPSSFLNFSLSVGYSSATFDQSGTIQDTSTFGGLTYSGSVAHQITRQLAHSLSYNSGINNGIGSNFAETTGINYGINWAFHPRTGIHAGIGWTQFEQTGSQNAFLIIPSPQGPTAVPIVIQSNQKGSALQFTTGTSLQLSRKLSSGLAYAYMKQSNNGGGQAFDQHSVTLTLSYSF